MQITGKISIYIHIPFCEKKCPYCQFYNVYPKDSLILEFQKALLKEIFLKKSLFENKEIISIYFGGGTPTLLNEDFINEVLKNFKISKKTEITIETNPENAKFKKFKNLKKIGINRASIGVQSFDDDLLKVLNRNHSSKDAVNAIKNINLSGIDNISIDLMYDIPNQSVFSFEKTLNIVKDLNIKHISLYNLTFEENTPFFKNKEKYLPILPSEKDSLKMLNSAIKHLKKNNFLRYEISAFCKKNYNSIHNIGYWTQREFLGFGPSSFSYIDKKREKNISNIKIYIKNIIEDKSIIDFEEKLLYPQNLKELFLINLRLIDGVDIKIFEKNNDNLPLDVIRYLDNSIFIKKNKNRYKLSKKGLIFYDTLASEII
jgi:oxygen-independent coproporphyrinogen-3 oxidase